MNGFQRTICLALAVLSGCAWSASASLVEEPGGEAYNFVTHYRIVVDAPIEPVWDGLIDLGAWMYDFEMSPVAGEPGRPGAVLRLYSGQEFLVQITAVDAPHLLAIANLPLAFRGEFGTGVGIMTLHRTEAGTEVVMSASRRYTPVGEGFRVLRETRESAEFQQRTHGMWARFLARLKANVEKAVAQ